ncbi:MAG: glycosyltransferase family 2 protein [Leptospiraceae bacterium]|nr:glycosyltransferase family 2 protein [Leptospiraceae bacterium]
MNNFVSKDICVLTPTKDRPHKIVNLLNSLVKQTQKIGRFIVVGSGENIESLIEPYKSKLPIEYYHSEIAGQIRQRKLGVSKLNNKTKLVATLDDDIILESDAIENLIKFWNSKNVNTVGVGLNLTNMKRHSYSRFKEFFFLSSKDPGKVLLSGYTTSLCNVESDIHTNWLNGGSSSWRQEILVEGIHKKNIDSTWAPCEDLMFSYPIGQKFDLWVCKEAKVIHDDNVIFHKRYDAILRGKILSKWTYEFVKQNPELSKTRFMIATIVSSLLNIFRRIFKKDKYFELGRLLQLFSLNS